MDKVEQIKSEINRLITVFYREKNSNKLDFLARISLSVRISTLEELLIFIDSIQKEPVSVDLEQEISNYVDIPDNQGLPELREELSECARYFAKWQENRVFEWIKKHLSNINIHCCKNTQKQVI